MSIALLYERSETDELGIKLTAEQLGVDWTFIPFRKIALSICKNGYSFKTKGKDYTSTIKDVAVVLNRAQSKNRRLFASHIMETFGKKTINPSQSSSNATANSERCCTSGRGEFPFRKQFTFPATPLTPRKTAEKSTTNQTSPTCSKTR